jgi:hypothetical protein
MADEVRRVETVEETPRDTVVVKEGRTNTGLIILGVIIVLLLIFFLWGNPFDNDAATDVTPDVNIPQDVDLNVPAPPTTQTRRLSSNNLHSNL